MKKFFKSSYFALMLLFIYIPIFVMIVMSFNSGNNLSEWQGFSTKWYTSFLENSPFVKSILVSLFVAVVSTIVSIVIGVLAVIGLSKMRRRISNNWVRVANIPLVNADVITAVGLMLLFIFSGLKFGIFTLISAHVSFNVPYVIITVLPFMKRIDQNYLDASKDLGATTTKTIWKVVLPILLPSIVTAAAICFAMSFDDFIISYFTGGDQTNVSTFIYTAKRMQPYINVFGVFMVIIVTLILLVWNGCQFINNKSKTVKELIKKGDYKIKIRNALENKIIYWKACMENEVKTRHSKSIINWIKYRILSLQLRIKKNKNFNSKISRLEWKIALLTDEIAEAKRVKTIHTKLSEKKKQIEAKIQKLNNAKKAQKFEAVIAKINKKLYKYEKEIEWFKDRDINDKQRAKEIGEEIVKLQSESASLQKGDKDYDWYLNKIKSLTKKQKELNEGRDKAKLRETVAKLEAMKAKSISSIEETYSVWLAQKNKVFKEVSLVEAIDKKIKKLKTNNASENEIASLLEVRNTKMQEAKDVYSQKIQKAEAKLNAVKDDINKKQEKYFPDVTAEGYTSKRTRWINRSWKRLSLGVLLLGSFGLLTAAYVKNNVYDLVVGNWGSYIDTSLLTDFEKENNVKINYQQYDSNESLYNKSYTFSYDIMVPSDYMAKKLAQENKLQKIDWCRVEVLQTPNFDGAPTDCEKNNDQPISETFDKLSDTLVNVDNKTVLDTNGEPILNYAIPYLWGDVRMIWNIKNQKVIDLLSSKGIYNPDTKETDESKLSWNILWEAADLGLDVKLNEDPKNVFMFAFEKLFGNVMAVKAAPENGNLSKQQQIDLAEVEVKKLVSKSNVGIYGDQLTDKIATGDFDVTVVYNGDAIYGHSDDYESSSEGDEEGDEEETTPNEESSSDEARTRSNMSITSRIEGGNPNLESISLIPNAPAEYKPANGESVGEVKQTTNIWTDFMVISKDNRNLDLTYKFINMIYSRYAQEKIAEETGYTVPTSYVIDNPPYDGVLGEWYVPTEDGEPFDLDATWDNYMVDKFNNIIATKN
ncbi:spermidine/putrescine ABC transporter permease/substrate-binding protein [Spiroplasma tabanidicola]|uniref:Spermidine/putrescine ABC transporter permease n=1 Tax=Spiroplasma tabanidicola TaxID=324079 RepID=A0A6I6C833_9MOLU|nr:spermidine/putrescine ABC transporter permease/substrate-binding protein [Spiroplasma tabanidicola]QGS51589.1 spermidine/putrescine ABC transporter permease [Spiroplasma tabanidicola]